MKGLLFFNFFLCLFFYSAITLANTKGLSSIQQAMANNRDKARALILSTEAKSGVFDTVRSSFPPSFSDERKGLRRMAAKFNGDPSSLQQDLTDKNTEVRKRAILEVLIYEDIVVASKDQKLTSIIFKNKEFLDLVFGEKSLSVQQAIESTDEDALRIAVIEALTDRGNKIGRDDMLEWMMVRDKWLFLFVQQVDKQWFLANKAKAPKDMFHSLTKRAKEKLEPFLLTCRKSFQ